MHLIDCYAASSGLQVSKPFLYTKFFPVPWDKYILVHAGAGTNAKRYNFFEEVIFLLRPILSKHGYEIVQIGGKEDPRIGKTVDFRGAMSMNHTGFLIQNAQLIIGNDSVNVHIASGFDIPIVCLYGPTTIANHGPYFSSPEKLKLLQADLEGKKPSYSSEENPKTINRIKPEIVAKAALELLKIDAEITRESIFFGDKYIYPEIDLIPDCVIDRFFLKDITPIIRMDLYFNEGILVDNLKMRKHRIITDKPISLDILKGFKDSIEWIMYDIKDNYSTKFIEQMRRAGANIILSSFMEGEKLSRAKLDMFDYGIILERKREGKSLMEKYNFNDEMLFRTNQFLLANNKIYLSVEHWRNNTPTNSIENNIGKVLMTPDFFDRAENFYIFKN